MLVTLVVITCPVCGTTWVCSAQDYFILLTEPKKVLVCSTECLDIILKDDPAKLN